MILLIFERCPAKTGHTTRVDSITVGNGELFVIAEGQHTLARVMRCIRVGSLSETELPIVACQMTKRVMEVLPYISLFPSIQFEDGEVDLELP